MRVSEEMKQIKTIPKIDVTS